MPQSIRRSIIDPSKMAQRQKEELAQRLRLSRRASDAIFVNVPKDQQVDRMLAYATLMRNHYTPTQALNVVTGTTPTGDLQPLDLSNPAWQHTMAVTRDAVRKQAKNVSKSKGIPEGKAMRIVMIELENVWTQKGKGEAFKGVDDFSPKKRRKADVIPPVTQDALDRRAKQLAREQDKQRRIARQRMQPSFLGRFFR